MTTIYIPLWLDLLYNFQSKITELEKHLHSTMVRFIIHSQTDFLRYCRRFTFHYGQIYYFVYYERAKNNNRIYIPLWLDLLSKITELELKISTYLHSTMVRFIIYIYNQFINYLAHLHSTMVRFIIFRHNFKKFGSKRIYIPLWLDLLCIQKGKKTEYMKYLHSTMVRFIIEKEKQELKEDEKFTFHYGQIYYLK